MFNPIKIHRSVMGQSCEYSSCEIGTQHGSNMPASVAFNTTPSNGFTNHYICHNHMVALIETIFDDPEYGPIARKIGVGKIAEYAKADALAEARAEAVAIAEAEAAAAPKEPTRYPCSKCGKPLKNPAARSIHEQHCKVLPVGIADGNLAAPADFKEAYGDKDAIPTLRIPQGIYEGVGSFPFGSRPVLVLSEEEIKAKYTTASDADNLANDIGDAEGPGY
jgi:hypothetical protein